MTYSLVYGKSSGKIETLDGQLKRAGWSVEQHKTSIPSDRELEHEDLKSKKTKDVENSDMDGEWPTRKRQRTTVSGERRNRKVDQDEESYHDQSDAESDTD